MRREFATRLGQPPAPSPTDTYPILGVPRPFYHQLQRVIPILDAPAWGVRAHSSLAGGLQREPAPGTWAQAVPQEPQETVVQPLAWVTITLADDMGTEYSGGQVVSTTSTGPGYYHGRVEYQFLADVNPDVHELRVSVPELRWDTSRRMNLVSTSGACGRGGRSRPGPSPCPSRR